VYEKKKTGNGLYNVTRPLYHSGPGRATVIGLAPVVVAGGAIPA